MKVIVVVKSDREAQKVLEVLESAQDDKVLDFSFGTALEYEDDEYEPLFPLEDEK